MTFASSPRSLRTSNISPSEIAAYLKKKAKFNIGPHFFHGVYLVNLGTGKASHLKAGINSLIFYQKLAARIGAVGTIFHIGSRNGRDPSTALDQAVVAINYILDSSPKGTKLILENAAGQGQAIGEKLEELAAVVARIGDKSKIGICLDTQHAFAAGYDLITLLSKFDQVLGLKRLTVVHLNDSKTDFSSGVDRHANLGAGKIGVELLKKLSADPRLKNIPFILEVPGIGDGPRKQDLDFARRLFSDDPPSKR